MVSFNLTFLLQNQPYNVRYTIQKQPILYNILYIMRIRILKYY